MGNFLTDLPVGRLTLAVNLPLLALAWFHLSRKFTIRTAAACGICSLILDFAIVGVGMALIFLSGSTTGGSDVVGYLMQKKYPHVSIGRALLLIDGLILSISVFVFKNVDAALFGLISLYVQTKVIDMMIYGNDAGSKVSIITRFPQEIGNRIIRELDRTATI